MSCKGKKSASVRCARGLVRDTVVEILQGVNPGETVVTAGQAMLKDGVQVRLSLQPKK